MDEKLKALLLLNSVSTDLRAWNKFMQYNAEPSALWKETSRFAGNVLSENAATKLTEAERSGFAEREYEACLKKNIKLIPYGTEKYPEPLYDLKDAPLVLYFNGNVADIPKKNVSVVGTRRATAYGKLIAYNIGNRAASENTAIISGGAAGIDGQAHTGCCNAHGTTFAIFGTGADVMYPLSNAELFERIKENGALISEFPLGTTGEAWHFPKRNRIIAALAQRLAVIEAPLKSGSMITAKAALELGREIWAVPGKITENVSEGTNRLIFDGAYPLINLDLFFGRKAVMIDFEKNIVTSPLISGLNEAQKKVLAVIARENDMTVDNIAVAADMNPTEVLKIASMLDALGLIISSGPGRYTAAKNF